MKLAYKLVLGLAGATMTGGLAGCSDTTVRTVVEAKGGNKLHLSNIADSSAYYVVDCGQFSGGMRLYRNVMPGDTITGKYILHRNRIYLTVSPDTVARYTINCSELPADFGNSISAEDQIIQELIIDRRIRQNLKTRQR